jgi:hypothetical protein
LRNFCYLSDALLNFYQLKIFISSEPGQIDQSRNESQIFGRLDEFTRLTSETYEFTIVSQTVNKAYRKKVLTPQISGCGVQLHTDEVTNANCDVDHALWGKTGEIRAKVAAEEHVAVLISARREITGSATVEHECTKCENTERPAERDLVLNTSQLILI